MTATLSPEDFTRLSRAHAEWLARYQSKPDDTLPGQLRLTDVMIAAAEARGADYTGALFPRCTLQGCVFIDCSFPTADFVGAVFRECTFRNCTMGKADFSGATARACEFLGCDFTRADLTDADFARAVLDGSVFAWAWLVRTDCRDASLENASFVATRFLDARLHNTRRFSFAQVRDVVGEVDLSPAGDRTVLLPVAEALARLRRDP